MIILKAIKKLKLQNKNINFVFCGRDKGYLENIIKKINEYEISENVKILDYVNETELFELYKLCEALVMPSYFGPTNIPPVEAWSLAVPVLYSSLNRKHGKNACLYFDAESDNQLSQCILKLDIYKKKLIIRGKKRLKEIRLENMSGHKTLANDIQIF